MERAAPASDSASLMASQAPGPRRARWRLFVRGARLASLLVLLTVGLMLAANWLLRDARGGAWLLSQLPQVQVQGWDGALLGPQWRARLVRVSWRGGRQGFSAEDLRVNGLSWQWRPTPQAWLGLHVAQLSARRIVWHGDADDESLPSWPRDLSWPAQLTLDAAQIGEWAVDSGRIVQAIELQGLTLGDEGGQQHRLPGLSFVAGGLQVSVRAEVGAQWPQPLQAEVALRPAAEGDRPAWAAVARVSGDAHTLLLTASLRSVPRVGHPAPELDLQTTLHPQKAWPLDGLDLRTQELDLAALWSGAPQTRISGSARMTRAEAQSPLRAELTLDNARPGRWDAGRLPVRRLEAQLQGQSSPRDQLDVTRLVLQLADDTQDAGVWQGRAVWERHVLTLQGRLSALTPQRLDARAPTLSLDGPMRLVWTGLPSPNPADTVDPPPTSVRWDLDLQGSVEGAPLPVQVRMEGRAQDRLLDVPRLRLRSGTASAELSLRLERQRAGGWQMRSSGGVNAFDPLPWWPVGQASVWRVGGHELTADWSLDLDWPTPAQGQPWLAQLQRLSGLGRLTVRESQLAGVPLNADLTLGYGQDGSAAARLKGQVTMAGAQLRLSGEADPFGSGVADRIHLQISAPDLAALAPLFRLDPQTALWAPRSGHGELDLAVSGRWPAARSEGALSVQDLQTGALGLKAASAQWQLDSGRDPAEAPALDRPLSLHADVQGLHLDGVSVDRLRAELQGTLAQHRVELEGQWPYTPPAHWLQWAGLTATTGAQTRLFALGSWQHEATGGGRWQARVQRWTLGPRADPDATSPTAASTQALWASGADLRAELRLGADGRLLALRGEPGRVRLPSGLNLRWDPLHIDLQQREPRFRLRVELAPFAVAPLLARAQPTLGWQGDLRLRARLDLHAEESLAVDFNLEHVDGDLQLDGPDGPQALGLQAVQVAISSRDGRWLLTPRLSGRLLGEVQGEVRLQSSSPRHWPDARSPLFGLIEAAAPDLGVWRGWMPVGWRPGGALRLIAVLGGRLGDPRFTGTLTGSELALRNPLLGLKISDGELDAILDGDKARIRRFTLRGGEGLMRVSGEAALGRRPQAELKLQAERFRVLGRVDRSLIASGEARLLLGAGSGRLDGRVRVDEGRFDLSRGGAPVLDPDVVLEASTLGSTQAAESPILPPAPERGAASRVRSEPMAAPTAVTAAQASPFTAALTLDLGQQLQVRWRGVDTALSGELVFTASPGKMALNGRMNAVDGTYAAYGQRLDITRGVLGFDGDVNNPSLDILALRPHTDVIVGVQVTGMLQTPRIRLYADPELGEQEKLSWLILGRAPDGLGRSDTLLLQRAAVALLAGEGEDPTDRLLRNLGLDEISLTQTGGDVRETVVTLGKQLSRRWYVGYERGVNAAAGTWQLIYRVAQRFTLRAQSGVDSSLDMIWTWRIQEVPPDAEVSTSNITPPP